MCTVEGAGLGALVRLADSFSRRDNKGKARLDAARLSLRKLLKAMEPDRVEVRLDGRRLPTRHLMVEVLNIAYGGPRLLFAPDVDPGDGQLDVLLLESRQRKDMRKWLKEEPVGRPPMTQLRGRKISIVWDGTPLHVDDDRPPKIKGLAAVELELTSEAATILVPAVNGQPGVVE